MSRAENYRIFEAAAALYETFRGERIEGLCMLTDHYAALSPATATREWSSNPLMQSVGRGWELFADVVPDDVAAPVFAILDRPGLLARRLDGCETTSTGGSGRDHHREDKRDRQKRYGKGRDGKSGRVTTAIGQASARAKKGSLTRCVLFSFVG